MKDHVLFANQGLFAQMQQSPSLGLLRQRCAEGGVLSFNTVASAAYPVVAAFLRSLFPERPMLLVVDGLKTQELFFQDLQTWLKDSAPSKQTDSTSPLTTSPNEASVPLFFYPAWENRPSDARLPHADVISERLETLLGLHRFAKAKPSKRSAVAPTVVASLASLVQKTFGPEAIQSRSKTLRRGDSLDLLDLIEWLESQGFEPEAQVNHKGEIALRGGILDVFPLTSPWPIRLEFFGNELESLRTFDPSTQVSREAVEEVVLAPAGELGVLKRELSDEAGESGRPRDPWSSLIDHFPEDSIVVFFLRESAEAHLQAHPSPGESDLPFYFSWNQLWDRLIRRIPRIVSFYEEGSSAVAAAMAEADAATEGIEPPGIGNSWLMSLEAFRQIHVTLPEAAVAEAQRREFFHQLHRWLRQGFRVHIFCNNEGERQRFCEIWKEYGLGASEVGDSPQGKSEPTLEIGALSRGFYCEEAKLVVVTDAEVFGRYKVLRARRLKSPHAAATRSALDIDFTEFEEGDYVVHVQYGIGRYRGLKQLEETPEKGKGRDAKASSSLGEECLVIEFAPSDESQPAPKLYVPVSEAHLVSKYVGTGKSRPPLNTLSGKRWAKAKAEAENAVRDLAAELLSIQAARETQIGHAFLSDNTWQREFEGSFLYEETVDQLRAIGETKRDMELAKPMDRLICGDVGYGKTEVAIRAAFKCVMGGKQVAILVPTTVLAQQHYNTFRERMADYPVRVELLSRFRRPKEIRAVIEQVAQGAVDIVIGTHRLIQKDVLFKDLGLVVIDEEQRFGVLHKERFKLLRRMVDVLTLSATPIPRTLYLALTGARDMSTIETPPQDRLPVETIVCQYDERVIRDAIERELNREGQVFFLHNRVFDIEAVASRLKALVPRARLLVGHGQMDPDDLEKVMTRFVNGEADVLLSTTIIESGIDIPNANTIIIDRADRFGLSDLYQLRGRVGRYKHQAYAYLLLPRHAGLLTDARKRISAIKQYSSLGSGFKIAMRDLEIRGAGNLLGPQQSGHITAVGFELYCQLLKQSISALKGEKVLPRTEVQVRLDFLAMNPAEERAAAEESKGRRSRKEGDSIFNDSRSKSSAPQIEVPREFGMVYYEESDFSDRGDTPEVPIPRRPAYIPMDFISDARQRIEIYRKVSQSQEVDSISKVREECRDRFGALPAAFEMLLQVQELKILALQREVQSIEAQGDKLKIHRRGDFILVNGFFPRLQKRTAEGRLKEIKKFLLAC